jgi:uncharacterized protein
MIERPRPVEHVRKLLSFFRAVELVGPRQVGKTTLARQFLPQDHPNYFDLELPYARALLANPAETLSRLDGLVVIDEVQNAPGLFQVLRGLIDRPTHINKPGQYLVLGSAAPQLLKQRESLLGRIASVELSGFSLDETGVGRTEVDRLWLRGGFPAAYLAPSDEFSHEWRDRAIDRFLRSDLPEFGINVPMPAMLRFWMMLAHFHGQIWNAAHPAQSMGVNESTVRRYLDSLTQTFMIRQLQPWHENLGKRQVKAPKIYFRDTGLLHTLMGIKTLPELVTHPRAGASWEGFALEQILRIAQPDEAYFWATHQGAELDLLMLRGQQRIGVEFKRADAPTITKSMRIAMHDLKLDALYVVYPGLHRYPMGEGVEAVPLWAVLPAVNEERA